MNDVTDTGVQEPDSTETEEASQARMDTDDDDVEPQRRRHPDNDGETVED